MIGKYRHLTIKIVALRKIADRLEDLLTQDINDSTMVSEQAETNGIVNVQLSQKNLSKNKD